MDLLAETKIVSSSIKITNSELRGTVNFSNCTFKVDIDFQNNIFCEDAKFKGTNFCNAAKFNRAKFNDFASFKGATFNGDAEFSEVVFSESFKGGAEFTGATFRGNVFFQKAKFRGNAEFDQTTFSMLANFRGGTFIGIAGFNDTTFSGIAEFTGSTFCNNVAFNKAKFPDIAGFGNVIFKSDAEFIGATFQDVFFRGSKFQGEALTFRDSKFHNPSSQEYAFRIGKNVLERNGDRAEAAYHFYREMDGKRKQKTWYYRYPEYILIQLIFGYGVHPFRLWACWFVFVGIFALIYWFGHGIETSSMDNAPQIVDYLWFSIATAVTPGYAGYRPTSDFKLVAGIEAILGTFMWAAFIATFSRKYMR